MSDEKKFINPLTFTDNDTPIIMLCDDLRGFMGWAIKSHTKGNYNHACIIHRKGRIVSQGFSSFMPHDITVYLTSGMMLKFWRIKDMTLFEKSYVRMAIAKRLGLPWWRRTYDFLGVIGGQLTGMRWIQNPFQAFCSEQVMDDYIAQVPRAKDVSIYKPSPSELNVIFSNNPEIMECLGYWWMD
jgi:hypothetical protein